MSYRHRRPTCPNGMNFTRAIHNPQSNISKIVNYLRVHGPQTKRTLLDHALGKKDAGRPRAYSYNGQTYMSGDSSRGYASYTFGLGVRLGLLTYSRAGRSVFWRLGPMADGVIQS